MPSTHDLISGVCENCMAPVRLFCAGCTRFMYRDEPHKKACIEHARPDDPEVTISYYCQCMPRNVRWGTKPKRRRKPIIADQPPLEFSTQEVPT